MAKIKWIEPVDKKEFESSTVLRSIAKSLRGREERNKVALYVDANGDCKTFKFGKATWFQKSKFKDKYMGFDMMFAVKIHYVDESWEYGFKFWREKEVKCKKYLVPIYLRDGVWDEKVGKIKPDNNIKPLPLWVMKMLPMYNEELIEAVKKGNDLYLSKFGMSVEDANTVWDAAASLDVTSDHGVYRKDLGFATCVFFIRKKTDWLDNYPYSEEYLDSQISVLSYFKSIYRQDKKTVHVYEVVPISSLCTINEDSINGTELWNNIEMTTKGIL